MSTVTETDLEERLRHDAERGVEIEAHKERMLLSSVSLLGEEEEDVSPSVSNFRYFEILHTDIVAGPFGHGKVPLVTVPAFGQLQVHSWAVETAFDDSGNLVNCGVTDAPADNQFSNTINLTNELDPEIVWTPSNDPDTVWIPTVESDAILLVRDWENDGTAGKLHLWLLII